MEASVMFSYERIFVLQQKVKERLVCAKWEKGILQFILSTVLEVKNVSEKYLTLKGI